MTIDAEKFWFKVTWVLGIDDILVEFKLFFTGSYDKLIKDLFAALEAKEWVKARSLLKKLLGLLKSEQFEEWLIKKIGKKKAKAILGKIGLKFLPGLGWLITAGMIVAALVGQAFID